MSSRDELVAFLKTQKLEKSDAIVVLEGDGFRRLDHAAQLYKNGLAEHIVLAGGLPETPYSIPAEKMAERAKKLGISGRSIIVEARSQNTKEQAAEVLRITQANGWQRLIIVASGGHEARAFLTFLKTGEVLHIPAFLSVASPDDLHISEGEAQKIVEYQKKGDVAEWEEGVQCLQWMQNQ